MKHSFRKNIWIFFLSAIVVLKEWKLPSKLRVQNIFCQISRKLSKIQSLMACTIFQKILFKHLSVILKKIIRFKFLQVNVNKYPWIFVYENYRGCKYAPSSGGRAELVHAAKRYITRGMIISQNDDWCVAVISSTATRKINLDSDFM